MVQIEQTQAAGTAYGDNNCTAIQPHATAARERMQYLKRHERLTEVKEMKY